MEPPEKEIKRSKLPYYLRTQHVDGAEPKQMEAESAYDRFPVVECKGCQKPVHKMHKLQVFCDKKCKLRHNARVAYQARKAKAQKAREDVGVRDGVSPQSFKIRTADARDRKHVKAASLLVNEGPSYNKGNSDGVDTPGGVMVEYIPHPKQVIFGQAIEAGAKLILFSAGIRSGKTYGAMAEMLKQPYVYDVRPNLGYLVAPINEMLRTPKRNFEAIAGNALVVSKGASSHLPPHFIMKPTASIPDKYFVIEMHTGEHADRMRGPTIAFAFIDEVQITKSDLIDVLRGRVLESGGVIVMVGTAGHPGHWTKTEIIDRAYRCGKCHVCVYDHYDLAKGPDGAPEKDENGKETRRYVEKDHDPEDCYGDPRIAHITCSTFDNIHLTKEQIQQIEADYALKDPIIARRELYAEYTGFEGLCYSRFDRSIHKSPYNVYNCPADAYIVAGLDFGANDPTAAAFVAKIGDSWHVIGEYCDDDRGKALRDHVEGIRRAAGPIFGRIRSWWHDPSGRIAAMEMSRYGLKPMRPARKRTATGTRWLNYRIEVLNSLILGRDEKERPYFQVYPTCAKAIHNLENRKWKRYVSKGEDGRERIVDLRGKEVDRNAGDEPAPGNDHVSDAIEYALVSEFVKGLYKPKTASQRKPAQEFQDVSIEANHSEESKNVSRALSGSIANTIAMAKRRPGRFRTGY